MGQEENQGGGNARIKKPINVFQISPKASVIFWVVAFNTNEMSGYPPGPNPNPTLIHYIGLAEGSFRATLGGWARTTPTPFFNSFLM